MYTIDEFATLLTRTFAQHHPRVIKDVNDKGIPVTEFMIPNPHLPRFAVSLQFHADGGYVDTCSLWFGQIEISGHMDADTAASAIEEIMSDKVVAILRYKNQDAYDDHRPSPRKWLYQITDDEDDESAELEAIKARLHSTPTLGEKISGKLLGVFEVFSWTSQEVIVR